MISIIKGGGRGPNDYVRLLRIHTQHASLPAPTTPHTISHSLLLHSAHAPIVRLARVRLCVCVYVCVCMCVCGVIIVGGCISGCVAVVVNGSVNGGQR